MVDSQVKSEKGAVTIFGGRAKGMAWVSKGIRTVGDMAFC
jgi:hypothetical protein